MPCEWYEKDGVIIHVNRGRSPGRMMKCRFCNLSYRRADGKLCDFPIGEGRTCDAEMCRSCARTLGKQATDAGGGLKRLNDTIDVCPDHRGKAVAQAGQIRALESPAPGWKPTTNYSAGEHIAVNVRPLKESAGFSTPEQSKLPFDRNPLHNSKGSHETE